MARLQLLLFACCLGGCDRPLTPLPSGDQSLLAGITVQIDSSQHDHLNYNTRIVPPPIERGHSVYVTINGGMAESRVNGLRILVNGKDIPEVGSAGLPQQFMYQYEQKPPASDAILLEFRYRDASFPLALAKPEGQILSPSAGAQVAADEALPLRFGAAGLRMTSLTVDASYYENQSTAPCSVSYTISEETAGSAMARPQRQAERKGPPCTGAVSVTWLSTEMPASPFASVRIQQTLTLLRRYEIR